MYNQIVDIYPEIFPLNREFLAFLPDYLGAPGSGVLDLGCGPGEYVDLLAQKGYRAVGIDSSTAMIARAQSFLQGEFHPFSFQEIGKLSEKFSCIYSIGNSISYIPAVDRRPFFEQVAGLHEQHGKLILQVINWNRYLDSGTGEFPVKELSQNRTFHRRYERVSDKEVLFHTELREGSAVLGSWSDPLYPLPALLLEAELGRAGYAVQGAFGDYQQKVFDPAASDALILTAEKR